MSPQCAPLLEGASDGIAAALRAVDCVSTDLASGAFDRLFGAQGQLLPALTILLTLYVAFFAFALLTGRSRIGIAALTPRFMLLGVVLTFATSWFAYQSVVWNLVVGAPDQIAGVIMGTKGPATLIFADKIDLLFQAIADAADAGNPAAVAAAGGLPPRPTGGIFAPDQLIWLAALLLMLGTVGILVCARILLAVLLALGPVFMVMALFSGTKGLTAGWLRALVLVAVAPLVAVLGGSLTIELAVPLVQKLAGPEGIEARSAFALFLVAAVHVALMMISLRAAGTIVGGWRVFGLAPDNAGMERSYAPSGVAGAAGTVAVAPLLPQQQAAQRGREIASAIAPQGGVLATTRNIQVTEGAPRLTGPLHLPFVEGRRSQNYRRAQGIGSRFATAPRTATRGMIR